jgi:sugar/nucleoside kinase (ribokinase family)
MIFQKENKYDIVGVAHSLVDVLAYVDNQFLAKHGMKKGSMCLIDTERAAYLLEHLRYIKIASGGSASNTMAGIASFGAKVALIGKVKDDELGAIFKRDIGMCGVDFCGVTSTIGEATGTCFVAVSKEDADRTMSTYLGAAVEIHDDDIDEKTIKNSAIIYIEGYLFDKEGSRVALKKSMDIATKYSNLVSMSLSDERCVNQHRDEILKILPNVNILFANEKEIMTLFNSDDLKISLEKIQQICDITTVTVGKEGSYIVSKDGIFNEPAAMTERKIVDTTGAGDLYASGFLYGIINNMSLEKCAKLGNLAAAEVITHMGARPEITLSSLLKKL